MKAKEIFVHYKKLIEESKDFTELRNNTREYLFQYYRTLQEETRDIIEIVLPKALAKGDKLFISSLYHARGWTHLDSGNYLEGIDDFQKAYELVEDLDFKKGMISNLGSLGYGYSCLGDLTKAFTYYDKALEIARDTNDEVSMYQTYSNMAEGFQDLKQYNEALVYFKKALELVPDIIDKAVVLTGTGLTYHHLGNNEEALSHLKQALDIVEKGSYDTLKISILSSLGMVYQGLGLTEKAIEMLKDSIRLAQLEDLPRYEANPTLALGGLLLNEGKINEALEYFQKSFQLAESLNATSLKIESLKEISGVFKVKGMWQEAYNYFKEYHQEYQEFFNQEAAKEIDRLKMNEATREAELFKKMYQQISAISQMGRELTSSLNLVEIVKIMYNRMNILMDTSVFGLALYDADKEEINYRFFLENDEWSTPFTVSINHEDSLGAWCIKNKKELIINDIKKDYINYVKKVSSTRKPEEEKIQAIICVPLLVGNKVTGIISVQSYTTNAYNDYQIEVFKALASYVSIAVENAKLYEEVQTMAITDPLTSLANRSHFLSLAEKEFLRFKRYGEIFSLIMLDLDRFKTVNDIYGHDSGDKVLKEVSLFLASKLRESDLFCRYGGEEFLMLLPHTNLEQALMLAEKLREELNNFKIQLTNNVTYSITASFGVTDTKTSDNELKEIIKRADTALYDSKSKGRNTVSHRR